MTSKNFGARTSISTTLAAASSLIEAQFLLTTLKSVVPAELAKDYQEHLDQLTAKIGLLIERLEEDLG